MMAPGFFPPPGPPDKPQALSALEAQLRSGDAAQATATREAALAQLYALRQRLRQRGAQGVPPAEFARLQVLMDACQGAEEILTIWPGKGR